jgi:hypothetical protein
MFYYYYSPPEFSETFVDEDDEVTLENMSITNDAIIQEIAQYQVKHNISHNAEILKNFMGRSGNLRMTGTSGLINNDDQKHGRAQDHAGWIQVKSTV